MDACSLQALCFQSTLWRACLEGSPESRKNFQKICVKNQYKRRNCLCHKCKKKSFILFYDCCVVMEHKATTSFNCPTTCSISRGEHKCYHQRRMSNTDLQLGKHRHQISHIGMKGPFWPLLCHFPVQWLSVSLVKIDIFP